MNKVILNHLEKHLDKINKVISKNDFYPHILRQIFLDKF